MRKLSAALPLALACSTSWISHPNTDPAYYERIEKANKPPQTIHDYCVENAEHYASYDECYAEKSEEKSAQSKKPTAGQAAGTILQGMGQGLQNSQRQQQHCTSTVIGNTVTTTCQ